MLQAPHCLSAGDKIAVVSPSWGGPGTFPHRYEAGKKQLESAFGVHVVEMSHALHDAGFVADNPKARADDLMQAFADTSIKGIIASIGGDDSIRLLPYLDFTIIRNNPKVFMGYSDATVLHFACMKAGLSSFYGPSMMAGFAENGGLFPYMQDSVRKTLFSADVIGEIKPCYEGWTVEHLEWGDPANQKRRRKLNPYTGLRLLQGRGRVQGRLIGGCAEVLEFMKGTSLWPSSDVWDGAILFLETSEDMPPPLYLRYWLRNYGASGILAGLSGIIFGRPGGHQLSPAKFAEYDDVLVQVVGREYGRPDMPILSHMDFGHTDPMFVLPYGRLAEIDSTSSKFSILESAVTL